MAEPSPEVVQPPRPKRLKREFKVEVNPDWTVEQQVEFINLWQSCPELYDFYHDDFTNNEKRLEVCAMLGQRLSFKRSGEEIQKKTEALQASWRYDRELVRQLQSTGLDTQGKPQLNTETYQLLMFLENGFPKGQRTEAHCLKHPVLAHKGILNRDRLSMYAGSQDVHANVSAFHQYYLFQTGRPRKSATVSGTTASAVDLSNAKLSCGCHHQSPDIVSHLSFIGCELSTFSLAKRESIMIKIKNLITETRGNLEDERSNRRNKALVTETNTVMSHLNTLSCRPCSLTLNAATNRNLALPVIPTPLWPHNIYPDLIPGWYQPSHWLPYYPSLADEERMRQNQHPNSILTLQNSLSSVLHNQARPSMDDSSYLPAIPPTPLVPNDYTIPLMHREIDTLQSSDSTPSTDSLIVNL